MRFKLARGFDQLYESSGRQSWLSRHRGGDDPVNGFPQRVKGYRVRAREVDVKG